jgi:hypothetical protein
MLFDDIKVTALGSDGLDAKINKATKDYAILKAVDSLTYYSKGSTLYYWDEDKQLFFTILLP